MRRKNTLTIIVAIAILAVASIVVLKLTKGRVKAVEGEVQIVFADKNMYNAVKREVADVATIKSSNDANMTLIMEETEIAKVEILNLYQENITNIQGIEKFTDLTALYIYSNKISDIGAISGLTKLTVLNIGDNSISDIRAIRGLTNLTTLQMISNQISDISVVSNLTNLTNLQIASNQISDISAISGLTKLTTLQMASNQISDISAISGLTNLTTLWMDEQKLTDRADAGSEYGLPQIFKVAKEKYSAETIETTNCTLSADENKITIGETGEEATVTIIGGDLNDSKLTISIQKVEEHTHTPSATYATNGTEHWKVCTECNEIIESTRSAHTVVKDAAVAATCTEAGKTEGSHCSTCGAVIKAQETIPAKGHTISTTYSSNNTQHWKVCTSCGEEILGTRANHEDQNKDGKCDTCGYTMSTEEPQEEHTHTPSATYATNGTEHWKVCTECNEIIESTRSAHTVVKDAAVAATCTETGKTEGSHCSVCNAIIKAQETVSAKGHTISTTYSKNNAQHWKVCTSCGEEIAGTRANHEDQNKDGKCDTCGYTMSTEKPKEEHKHTPSTTYSINNTQHWKKCTSCREEIVGTRANHEDQNKDGKCDACGYTISSGNNSGSTNTNSNTNNSSSTNTNSNTNNSSSTNTNSNTNNNSSTNTNTDTNKKDMPYTGKEDIAIIAVVVIGLVTLGVIKIKQYKEI